MFYSSFKVLKKKGVIFINFKNKKISLTPQEFIEAFSNKSYISIIFEGEYNAMLVYKYNIKTSICSHGEISNLKQYIKIEQLNGNNVPENSIRLDMDKIDEIFIDEHDIINFTYSSGNRIKMVHK